MKLNMAKIREALKSVFEGSVRNSSDWHLPNTVKGTKVYPKSGRTGPRVVGRKITPDDLRKTIRGE